MTTYTIDNVADCQSALVDYIEMQGLSGYAAAEASETISGSWASVKAAFSDLLVGMADDKADMDMLLDNLVTSVGDYLGNIGPVVRKTLNTAERLFDEYGPKIAAALPGFLEEKLPQILRYGGKVVHKIVDGIYAHSGEIGDSVEILISKIGDWLAKNGPDVAVKGALIIAKLAMGFVEAIPDFMENIPVFAKNLGDAIYDHREEFKDIGRRLCNFVKDGFKGLWDDFTGGLKGWIGSIRDMDEIYAQQDALHEALKNPQPAKPTTSRPKAKPQINSSRRPQANWLDGSHADGLPYVPFDGYIAELHRGERVLTAEENKRPGITIIQNIYSEAMSAADLMAEARYKQEEAIFQGV